MGVRHCGLRISDFNPVFLLRALHGAISAIAAARVGAPNIARAAAKPRAAAPILSSDISLQPGFERA
jgi:hypothetical protein